MAAELVNPARGTVLQIGSPYSAPSYSSIAQIVSLDGPSREIGTRETTILTSTSKTYAPTIFDGGEVTGKLLYDPTGSTHSTLETIMAGSGSLLKWKVIFNDSASTSKTFDGIFTQFQPTGIEVEANLEADFTIKVSGAIT